MNIPEYEPVNVPTPEGAIAHAIASAKTCAETDPRMELFLKGVEQ